MGLISRVSSRTYRKKIKKFSKFFQKKNIFPKNMTLPLLSVISSTPPENYHSITEANFGNNPTEKAFSIQWMQYLKNNQEELKKFHRDGNAKKEITNHLLKYSFLGGSGHPTFVDLILYSLVSEKIKSTYQVDRL